jgi:glucose dehydrogenase
MRIRRLLLMTSLLTLCIIGMSTVAGQGDDTPQPSPTPGVIATAVAPDTAPVPAVPPEVEQFAAEWPMSGRDYANTRAVLDSPISSATVDQLGVAWTFEIPGIGSYGGTAAGVVIANGIVYFQDLRSNVYALDLETGGLLWTHEENQNVIGPNGPAIGYGKVFAQVGAASIVALDIDTGELLWETGLEGPTGAQQPYVYGGYVLTAAVAGAVNQDAAGNQDARQGYAPGYSGVIYALDQATGEIVWRFQVVTEDFWGNPNINGGGGVWYPPAVDTETGMTFWGTGNPAPFPGTVDYPNAVSRPGPNLYTNSLVALDLQTGEMLWYNQVKPHDMFDLDFQSSPILTTISEGENERAIVIGSGKLGEVVAFDRATGEMLWNTSVGIHQNDDLTELPLDEEIVVYPGVWGGVQTPLAYAEGVVYTPVLNLPSRYTATAFDAEDGTEAVLNTTGRINVNEATSEVVAIEAATGSVLWVTEFDEPLFSAPTVLSDVVFISMYDGTTYALSRADGSIVWTYEPPAGTIAWAAAVGDTLILPMGVGSRPVIIALRLGAEGVVPTPQPWLTPVPTPGMQG